VTAPLDEGGHGEPVADATIFVCVSCRRKREGGEEAFDVPGPALVTALEQEIGKAGAARLTVTPVECLAVCKRPCTVALVGREKWTYLVGDLDPEAHAAEIVSAALAFARSENGIVPWKERPATFRRGVISRVPPLGFVQPKPKPVETERS
jgi:predicted metal-binding protein